MKIASSCGGFVISHAPFHRTLSKAFCQSVTLCSRIPEPLDDVPKGYANVQILMWYGNFSNHCRGRTKSPWKDHADEKNQCFAEGQPWETVSWFFIVFQWTLNVNRGSVWSHLNSARMSIHHLKMIKIHFAQGIHFEGDDEHMIKLVLKTSSLTSWGAHIDLV